MAPALSGGCVCVGGGGGDRRFSEQQKPTLNPMLSLRLRHSKEANEGRRRRMNAMRESTVDWRRGDNSRSSFLPGQRERRERNRKEIGRARRGAGNFFIKRRKREKERERKSDAAPT